MNRFSVNQFGAVTPNRIQSTEFISGCKKIKIGAFEKPGIGKLIAVSFTFRGMQKSFNNNGKSAACSVCNFSYFITHPSAQVPITRIGNKEIMKTMKKLQVYMWEENPKCHLKSFPWTHRV